MDKKIQSQLTDSSPDTREEAALEIAISKDKSAVEFLINRLAKETEKSVKEMIIHALGKIGDKEALQPLTECFKDDDTDIRWVTAVALGGIHSQESIKLLLNSLAQEQNWVVKESIIKSLGQLSKLNPKTIIRSLVPFINNEHPLVSMAAATCIEQSLASTAAVTLEQSLASTAVTTYVEPIINTVDKLKKLGEEYFINSWQILTPETEGAMGEPNEQIVKIVSPILFIKIEGQDYKVQISYQGKEPEGELCFKFQLKPLDDSANIPIGYKLRLLSENLENYEGNEVEAQDNCKTLEKYVILEGEEGIAWETEPHYEGYKEPEIIPFEILKGFSELIKN